MADTSGTVAQTTVDVADILDEAILRCGAQPAQMTPEIVATLTRNLYFILARLTNKGVALWAIEKNLLALSPDQVSYSLEPGTVNILTALYCEPARLTYTGNPTATFTDASVVSTVGLLPSATGTATIVFEASNDAVTWVQVMAATDISAVAGRWLWFDIDPAPGYLMWQVRATVGTLTLSDLLLSNTSSEIAMSRLNRDEYTYLPSKRQQGQPLQFWFDRQIPAKIHTWPMPITAQAYVRYWRQRQPQDVGDLSNRLDLPPQWFDAIVYKLAAQAILVVPGADIARHQTLMQMAVTFEQEAENDETDHGPRRYHPSISGYTR